jgi:hypothetical protein
MNSRTAPSLVSRAAGLLCPDPSDRPFVADPRARIFLLSFTILFFELVCIRWIPSYVRYLSYFNNFILLASFLGIGVGMLAARRRGFWFPPFPLLLLALVIVVAVNRFDFKIASTEVLFYGLGEEQGARAEHFLVLPLMVALVAACFIPLARPLGALFTQVRPLTAYTADILGSLAGTAAFFAVAYFSLPPVVWFGGLAALLLLLGSRRGIARAAAPVLASVAIAFVLQQGAYWSPYYKIRVYPGEPRGYVVDVNNAGGHQLMAPWQDKEPFYRRVYEIFPGASFERALILGAGSGSDVATALAHGVSSVTAVEIDPTIQALGAQMHPDQPYSDPRVRVVINDGRAYLHNTSQRYDLVLFALPDSLTLTSGMANLRLESFLLTREAIEAAKRLLTDDGLVVLYNYYREDWLVQKLAAMAGEVFGQEPLVSTYGGWGRAAVIMAGPRLQALPPGAFGTYREDAAAGTTDSLRVIGEGFFHIHDHTPATDNWPFVYLPRRSFPLIYVAALATLGLIALGGVFAVAPRSTLRRFDWHMFFLGAAFALLETRALITFALLFGTTWMVNSLVFFAILFSVLLSILVNARFRLRQIWIAYGLLFGMLAVNLLLPTDRLLFDHPLLRYALASLLAFAPVFLANVIFSNAFRDTEQADVAFASNLLGIMAGGTLEYLSMLLGHHLLLLPIVGFYLLAMLLRQGGSGLAWLPSLTGRAERSAGSAP